MEDNEQPRSRTGYTRRDVLKAGAAAQTLVWVAPAVTVLRPTAALAASPAPKPDDGDRQPRTDERPRPTRSARRPAPTPQLGGTAAPITNQLAATGLDAGSLAALGGSAAFVGGAALHAARKRDAHAKQTEAEQGPVDTD